MLQRDKALITFISLGALSTAPWILAGWVWELILYWIFQSTSYIAVLKGRSGLSFLTATCASITVLAALSINPLPSPTPLSLLLLIYALTIPLIAPPTISLFSNKVDEAWVRRVSTFLAMVMIGEAGISLLSMLIVRSRPTIPELLILTAIVSLIPVILVKIE